MEYQSAFGIVHEIGVFEWNQQTPLCVLCIGSQRTQRGESCTQKHQFYGHYTSRGTLVFHRPTLRKKGDKKVPSGNHLKNDAPFNKNS